MYQEINRKDETNDLGDLLLSTRAKKAIYDIWLVKLVRLHLLPNKKGPPYLPLYKIKDDTNDLRDLLLFVRAKKATKYI